MRITLPPQKKDNGFSLIEVLLVVLVIGAIVIVLSNLPSSLGLIGNSRYETKAKEIVVSNIEQIRNTPYANLSNGSTTINDSRIQLLASGSGTVSIEDCAPTICPNGEAMKEVTVTVNWKEKNNPKKVEAVTLVTSGGIQ